MLVGAFRGWNDGAQGASLATSFLAQAWEARRFANIDPEEFYDFQATRPHVALEEGITRRIDWPDTVFYHAPIPGTERDAVLMQGRDAEAAGWFTRSAERYRESWPDAPPASWGRLIGALKARVLARDWEGAETDARWALEQDSAADGSPIGAYAAMLAHLILGQDSEATQLRGALEDEEAFPAAVAAALSAVARGHAEDYAVAVAAVLGSFEERDEYLEDIPVADTVIVLEALAERRGMATRLSSALLP